MAARAAAALSARPCLYSVETAQIWGGRSTELIKFELAVDFLFCVSSLLRKKNHSTLQWGMLHTAAERETATEGDRGGEGCWGVQSALHGSAWPLPWGPRGDPGVGGVGARQYMAGSRLVCTCSRTGRTCSSVYPSRRPCLLGWCRHIRGREEIRPILKNRAYGSSS